MAKVMPEVRYKNGIGVEGFLGVVEDLLRDGMVVLDMIWKGVIMNCYIDNRAVHLFKTDKVTTINEKF